MKFWVIWGMKWVSQGSVPGPLLCQICINDLEAKLELPCFIFADDVKAVRAGNYEELARNLRKCLTGLWSGKCHKMKAKVTC